MWEHKAVKGNRENMLFLAQRAAHFFVLPFVPKLHLLSLILIIRYWGSVGMTVLESITFPSGTAFALCSALIR